MALIALAYLRYVAWQQRRTRPRTGRRASPAPGGAQHARPRPRPRPPQPQPQTGTDDYALAREAIEIADRYQRELHTTTAQLAAVQAELDELRRQPDIRDDGWLDDLLAAIHLLVIGHTRAGKTTLVHWLATTLAADRQQVIVCDLDAAPGL